MKVLSGAELGTKIEEELKPRVADLKAMGCTPAVVVIRVGDDPATGIYVRNKLKAAERVGIRSRDIHLPEDTSQAELEAAVRRLNRDRDTHGILCQLPLPAQMDESRITELIDPLKDVDCFHPTNFGLMAMGTPRFLPCTPAGIMEILRRYEIPLAGRRVVVLGRSNIVGRPLALLLTHKGVDATVTLCHSRTQDAPALMKEADVLIAAIGAPEWVKGDMVKPGAAVVDVGIHRVDDPSRKRGYRICGDVDQAEVSAVAGALTPVPGGVGPMTITMLLNNVVAAASLQRSAKTG
jgi:methylenetetrahydrofolate dehydrogenase (NADP+)/methenyltetrahydrofolate cyclohydrolase